MSGSLEAETNGLRSKSQGKAEVGILRTEVKYIREVEVA
jgi:hypothetical protein